MGLKKQIAQSCDISEKDAERELDCAVENLHATMEKGYDLTYDELEEEMYGLGVELTDDNFEEILNRLMY